MHCCTAITTIHLQNFSITGVKLCTTDLNDSPFPPPSSPGKHHPTFCLHNLTIQVTSYNGINTVFVFCDYLNVSSKFICIVCVELPSFLRPKNSIGVCVGVGVCVCLQ